MTRRYCAQWLTVTRKQRVDEKWWSETLSYWKEKNTAISRAEDEMLLQKYLGIFIYYNTYIYLFNNFIKLQGIGATFA